MLSQSLDVFKSFHSHKVKYVVIGGIAVIIYGVPRATADVDILIEATPENAQRLLDSLLEAGLCTASLTTAKALLAHEITVFRDRVRTDVQTFTPGISFEDAWERKATFMYQDQEFYVLSKDDLITTKRAAGHPVDLDDVKLLTLSHQSDKNDL